MLNLKSVNIGFSSVDEEEWGMSRLNFKCCYGLKVVNQFIGKLNKNNSHVHDFCLTTDFVAD